MRQKLGSKQPYEEYYISFNFLSWLGSDTISSATVSAVDMADNSDVVSTITDSTKQYEVTPNVYVWIRAGTNGHRYQITCRIVSSSGSKYELDAMLQVIQE
jgi:hypothetical protein